MKFRLKKLTVDRVDLVDNPANPLADMALIYKRDDGFPATDSTLSDIQPLEVSVPEIETPEAVVTDSLEDQLAAVIAERDAALAEVATLTVPAEVVLPELEPVAMADLRKSLDDAQAEIAKMKHDARVVEYIAKAKTDLDNLGEPAELGGLLLAAADALPADTYQTLERTLKAANAQVNPTLFKQIGDPNAQPAEVEDQITAAAKALVDKGESKNIGLAKMEVLKRNPELREAYESARRA